MRWKVCKGSDLTTLVGYKGTRYGDVDGVSEALGPSWR